MADKVGGVDMGLPKVVVESVKEGKVVFYGEFRNGTAVENMGKGRKLYRKAQATVETEKGSITVVEFLPDDVDWKTYKWPFNKGQMVMGICRGMEEASGAQVCFAKLVAV